MNLKSLQKLIVKGILILVGVYLSIIVVAGLVIGYTFINIDKYKHKLQESIFNRTGYVLSIGSVNTGLQHGYLPELTVNDIQLTNSKDNKQKLQIKRVNIVLSYASIINFEPVFRNIEFDGSVLNIVHTADGSLVVNGISLKDQDSQTLANTKANKIDFEKWALKQRNISLDHIDINYLDSKNGLPLMEFRNLGIGLEHKLWSRHRLFIDVATKNYQNVIEASLVWKGDKFEDWEKWKFGELKVSLLGGGRNVLTQLQQYIPSIGDDEKYRANTALDVIFEKGRLQSLVANFDVNNFNLALANADIVNFPKLGGNLTIRLADKESYVIEARNLQFVTSKGSLFNNSQINGSYVYDKHGNVTLTNTNLFALNNIISLFDITRGLTINGTIQFVSWNWGGSLFKPTNFGLNAKFNDISVVSSRPDIPSLSHVSGNVNIGDKQGKVDFSLKDSVLNYDEMFLIPYEFKSLTSSVEWKIDAKKKLTVVLHKTPLVTKDFSGWVSGEYTHNPATPVDPDYLTMYAHVDRVQTSKVGDYLPKSIPMSVHEWLNMGLVGGYGNNADMILRGPISDFPFQNGKGLFYITADLDNAKLQYVKDWPMMENIRGQFILKNTNITIKANSAKLSGNDLESALVVIPDYSSATGVYLVADGQAKGTTANFMTYLKGTPISKVIGNLPDKIASLGNGQLNIHLKVPFNEPKHTEVKGNYHFIDNSLQFDMPIPLLTHVNGNLGFTHHGVDSQGIDVVALNSPAKLTATTAKNGTMSFNVDAPQLDFQELARYYLPPFTNLISGRAPTQISFSVGKGGIQSLQANSNLQGVIIDLPTPLNKVAAESENMNFVMVPERGDGVNINWSLGALLRGTQHIAAKSSTLSGQVAIGQNVGYSPQQAGVPLSVNVNLAEIPISEWIVTASTMVKTIKQLKEESALVVKNARGAESLVALAQTFKTRNIHHYSIFPMQINASSDNFMLGKSELKSGRANIVVDENQTYFNLYSLMASGYGNFNYRDHQVDLQLDKYFIVKKPATNIANAHESQVVFDLPPATKMAESLPDISLVIKNLFFYNHNLGKVNASLHQDGKNLILKNGVLQNKDAIFNFSGVNYCFACGEEVAYVDFHGVGDILNLGNQLEKLNLGQVVSGGKGKAEVNLEWNGGFQNFNILQTVGSINAHFEAGKFLKVNPGLLGGLMSIINLQGVFEFGSGDVSDIFKQGFFFNTLDLNTNILATRLELKNIYISGPLANVNSYGSVNFGNRTVDAYVAVAPKLGVAVALAAGVVTLDPLVGIAVYLGELAFDDPQNKVFTQGYHVYGDLKKPTVESSKVKDMKYAPANLFVSESSM